MNYSALYERETEKFFFFAKFRKTTGNYNSTFKSAKPYIWQYFSNVHLK